MVARKQINVSVMATESRRASSLQRFEVPPVASKAPIRLPKHTAAIAKSQPFIEFSGHNTL